ncbi:hypothetical protein DICA2_E12596 [Diutina catenulata]
MAPGKKDADSTRKIAQVTRALVACDSCRKLKTRCHRDPTSSRCLRCNTLDKRCSHEINPGGANGAISKEGTKNQSQAHKLESLQASVDKILAVLSQNDYPRVESRPRFEASSELSSPTPVFLRSPFAVAANWDALGPISMVISGTKVERVFDDVPELADGEALELISAFCNGQYPRWASVEETTAEQTLQALRNGSTLLLYTCLVLSMRYLIEFGDRKPTYQKVGERMLAELRNSLSQTSWRATTMGTLQAYTLISIYSISITTTLERLGVSAEVLDPWYLSGIGLAGLGTGTSFGLSSFVPPQREDMFSEAFDVENHGITQHRVFNHLVLVHLASCILSGRSGMVDIGNVLIKCRGALSLPGVNNFDGRMISEIEVLAIAYKYLQAESSCAFPEDDMENWQQSWSHLFSLHQLEFVRPTFHFCEVVMRLKQCQSPMELTSDPGNESRIHTVLAALSDDARDEVWTHASQVLQMVHEIDHDYFSHVSDQIQFFFFYCAWMCLCMRSDKTPDISGDVEALCAMMRVSEGDILGRYYSILVRLNEGYEERVV